MTLEIEDGINFYIGQQIGEMVVGLIGMGVILVIGGIIYLSMHILDWWTFRKMRYRRTR